MGKKDNKKKNPVGKKIAGEKFQQERSKTIREYTKTTWTVFAVAFGIILVLWLFLGGGLEKMIDLFR